MSNKRIMSTYKSASEAHRMSEELRENDKHVEALQLIEIAIVDYQKEGNYVGLTKALQSRILIYKHLFFLSNDEVYAILAIQDAESSLRIAEKHNLHDVLSSCYFRLGEAENLFKNYANAVDNFKKALEKYSGSNAEKGDYKYHLGEALYRTGNVAEGKEVMLQGLEEIQNNRNEVDSFLINVWESGCYIKLAELLKNDEPDKAKEYLNKAEKISESDNKLVIRRRQIQDLAKSF